ncbi:MAG: hypothetical protein FWB93_01510 [Oscillospiraceae bacterium]|nr:hypothetical protein [Oscillospiraceae bacterium]
MKKLFVIALVAIMLPLVFLACGEEDVYDIRLFDVPAWSVTMLTQAAHWGGGCLISARNHTQRNPAQEVIEADDIANFVSFLNNVRFTENAIPSVIASHDFVVAIDDMSIHFLWCGENHIAIFDDSRYSTEDDPFRGATSWHRMSAEDTARFNELFSTINWTLTNR